METGRLSEWKGQQETRSLMREMAADGKELGAEMHPELGHWLAGVVTARFAELVFPWDGRITDEFKEKLRGLRNLSREVVRLRRGDLARDRTQIQRDAQDLNREIWEFDAARRCREKWHELSAVERKAQWTNLKKDETFRSILFPPIKKLEPQKTEIPAPGPAAPDHATEPPASTQPPLKPGTI